jgi:hypothetical protein
VHKLSAIIVVFCCLFRLDAEDLLAGSLRLRELSNFGGATPTGACEEAGGYLYFPTSSGLLVVDARDRAHIKFVTLFPLTPSSGGFSGAALKLGKYLHVGIRRTVQTFDISVPAAPILIQTQTLPVPPSAVTFPVAEMYPFDGRILIRTGGSQSGLERSTSYEAFMNDAGHLAISILGDGPFWGDNDLLCGGELFTVKIWRGSPRALIASFETRVPTGNPQYPYQPISNIFIKDKFVFVRCGVNQLALELVGDTLVERNISLLPNYYHDRYTVRESKLWVNTSYSSAPRTWVVDLQNPASPRIEAMVEFEVQHVGPEIGVAYSNGILLFDTKTNLFAPLGRSARTFDIHNAQLVGTRLVGSGSDLFSFSLENPEQPSIVNTKIFDRPLGAAVFKNGRLFVARSGPTASTIEMFTENRGQISGPIASAQFSPELNSFTVESNRIFFRVSESLAAKPELIVLDHDLQHLGTYVVPEKFGTFDSVLAREEIFYLRCRPPMSSKEFWLSVNLADFNNPQVTEEIAPIRESRARAMIDNYLFVLTLPDIIEVYDTSDTDRLKLISSLSLGERLFYFLTYTRDILVVAGTTKSFFLDYSDPLKPRLLGSIANETFRGGQGIYHKPFLYWCNYGKLTTFAVLPEHELAYSYHASQLHFYLRDQQYLDSKESFNAALWQPLPSALKHSIPLQARSGFFRGVSE